MLTWCLQSDAVPDPRLQAGADKKAKDSKEKKEMPEGFGMREYPEMIKVHMPKKKTKKVDKTDIAGISAQMTKLMTEHAPDKVGNVAFLMDKFKGREDKLLQQFKSKYVLFPSFFFFGGKKKKKNSSDCTLLAPSNTNWLHLAPCNCQHHHVAIPARCGFTADPLLIR